VEDVIEEFEPSSDPRSMVRSFVSHLDEKQKEEFERISDQLGEDYSHISPLQIGVMTITYMIQTHLLGKGFVAATEDKDLSDTEQELLDWARKTYKNEVSNVLRKEEIDSDKESVHEKVQRFLDKEVGDEEIVHEPDFDRVSVEDIEADRSDRPKKEKSDEKEEEIFSEERGSQDSEGNSTDSGDDSWDSESFFQF